MDKYERRLNGLLWKESTRDCVCVREIERKRERD